MILRRVEVTELEPGDVLAGVVYAREDVRLLRAGPAVIESVRPRREADLVVGYAVRFLGDRRRSAYVMRPGAVALVVRE